MKLQHSIIAASILALSASGTALAQEKTLRLLTWADYAPADIVAQFEKESGYKVEVTLSNNEEMISKLRATGGAGFDLAQPSQDRITGPQQEFGIYKPMDLSKLKSELFIPSMLDCNAAILKGLTFYKYSGLARCEHQGLAFLVGLFSKKVRRQLRFNDGVFGKVMMVYGLKL